MTEYKINNAVVRIHGDVDHDRLRTATEKFMKKVLKCRRTREKELQGK